MAWWLPAGQAEHIQPQPGICRLTTPPTAGWPLNKAHMVLAQGYLLHSSKYLQAQAPDDLNTLRKFTSLCSRTHSQSVTPSPVLLPWPVPAGSGVFLKQHWEEQAQHIPLLPVGRPCLSHTVWHPECPDVRPSAVINLLAGINIHEQSYLLFSSAIFFPHPMQLHTNYLHVAHLVCNPVVLLVLWKTIAAGYLVLTWQSTGSIEGCVAVARKIMHVTSKCVSKC